MSEQAQSKEEIYRKQSIFPYLIVNEKHPLNFCNNCGEYYTSKKDDMCPMCRKLTKPLPKKAAKKKPSVLLNKGERTCQECGAVFYGGSTAKYCNDHKRL